MDDSTIDSSSQPASQTSNNPSPKKKKRHRQQLLLCDDKQLFINAKTTIFTSPTKTRWRLGTLLTKAGLPEGIISENLVCRAINMTEQTIQFIVLNRQYGQYIFDVLNASPKFEVTFSNFALQPHTIDEIELPSTELVSFPYNCPFTTCTAHNGGFPYFDQTNQGQLMAQTHSKELHSDLLLTLPPTTLNRLGWTRCCHNCHELFLIKNDLSEHQDVCLYFSGHISQQRTTTPSSLHTNMSLHIATNTNNATTTKSKYE